MFKAVLQPQKVDSKLSSCYGYPGYSGYPFSDPVADPVKDFSFFGIVLFVRLSSATSTFSFYAFKCILVMLKHGNLGDVLTATVMAERWLSR